MTKQQLYSGYCYHLLSVCEYFLLDRGADKSQSKSQILVALGRTVDNAFGGIVIDRYISSKISRLDVYLHMECSWVGFDFT